MTTWIATATKKAIGSTLSTFTPAFNGAKIAASVNDKWTYQSEVSLTEG